MASSSRPSLTELQPPDELEAIIRTFEGYRMTLQGMTPPQLLDHLTRINAQLEIEARSRLTQTIQAPLSDYISNLDQSVVRLRPTVPRSPSPRDRGAAHSQTPASPQPSPLDLLFGSRGRRLAGKLVAANARSINGRR